MGNERLANLLRENSVTDEDVRLWLQVASTLESEKVDKVVTALEQDRGMIAISTNILKTAFDSASGKFDGLEKALDKLQQALPPLN